MREAVERDNLGAAAAAPDLRHVLDHHVHAIDPDRTFFISKNHATNEVRIVTMRQPACA